MLHPAFNSFITELKVIPDEFRIGLFPATHFMAEWREYFVSLPGVDQLVINGGKPLPPIIRQENANIFRVYIENSLGLTSFQAFANQQPIGEPLWVEVVSYKFPTPAAHLDFCQTLVSDLFAQSARMPFDFSDQTQRGVTESLHPPTPIFTYHFLIHSLGAFQSAIEIVLAQPYRVLADRMDQVLLHEASEVDGDVLLSILQAPETWVPSGDFEFSPALRVNGIRHAPQKVWQWLPEETFDTPENRFVLHFLRQVLTAIETLPSQGWWPYVRDLTEARALHELATLLRQAVSHPMFDEVGELHTVPFHSQVLMRREGYRNLMLLWQQFHTARAPLFDRWQQAIDLRAIYQLYELWVFFELVREIEAISPLEKLSLVGSDENGVDHGAKAIFCDGSILLYNQKFRPRTAHLSYSMELRPDYVWIGQGRQVVLDAKFSMQISEYELEGDIDGESQVVRNEHPLPENLYKMHTYRDALAGTQAAVIIYPGNKPVFMPTHGKRVYDFTLAEVLSERYERLQNKIQLDGIGAIGLKPGREP